MDNSVDRLTPPSDEVVNVEIIGYESVKVPSTSDDIESATEFTVIKFSSTDDIRSVAKSTLDGTLTTAEYAQTGEKLMYGNTTGRQLLEERNDFRTTVERLEKRLDGSQADTAELGGQVRELGGQVRELRGQVRDLALSSEGYRRIRHRFLDVYRRDVMQDVDRQGYQHIKDGNEAAHHADAVTDSALYTSNTRSDELVFIEIYGMSAAKISALAKSGDMDSIKAINAGATWRANQSPATPIPQDVDVSFTNFTRLLNLGHGERVTDGTTPLSKAYYEFWAAHDAALKSKQ